MKNKNLITLLATGTIALSAAVFGLTKVINTNYASGDSDTGTFTLNETENNIWVENNNFYVITSDRNTSGSVGLFTWYSATVSKKDGAFCNIALEDGDSAQIVVSVMGITSFSWNFSYDVNFSVEGFTQSGGFEYFKDFTTKTGTADIPEIRDDVETLYFKFNAGDNQDTMDLDVFSISVTYSVDQCLAMLD